MSARLYVLSRVSIRAGWLLLFFFAVSISLAQTTYYVASSGSDTNDGRSATAPFQNLSRVNSVILQPGDSVLFHRGDTFRGTLQIRQSGTSEEPICIDAYGTGNKPILAGSVLVRDWKTTGTNRWEAPCPTCGSEVTGLYANGIAQPLGRYPNADAPNRGSLTVQAHIGTGQLTSQEPLATNWIGAEVVLRPTYWIIDRARIAQQHGTTLLLTNPSTYTLTDGWGFFIQNHPATLDQVGEWYYNPSAKTIQLYSTTNPNNQAITATANDRVIELDNTAFIQIQNLSVTQARRANLYAQNGKHLVLKNNEFIDSGEDGVLIMGTGRAILIEKNTIANCNNNGVYIADYQDVIVRESTIRHIGVLPGRGKSGDGQFTGFQTFSTRNTLIENNIIDSVGYLGLHVLTKTTIRQNQVSNFCMVKSDGGGIYLWNGSQQPTDSVFILSNIIRRGVGTAGGLSDNTISGAHGIFLDDCMDGVSITDNTITDCQGLGIYLHAVSRVNLFRNTCFNNSLSQLILYNYGGTPCLPRNNRLRENIFLAKTADQGVAGYISVYDDLTDFGRMERNYYVRPFNDLSTVRAVYNQTVVGNLNLTQWQAAFEQDLTSRASPITYKEYRIKNISPTNRMSLAGNSDGWQTWSSYNNGQASWNSGGQSPTGRLTLSFANSSGRTDSYLLVYKGINSVEKATNYLVRFSAKSPVAKKMVVFIRQRQSPYQDLSRRYEFMAGPTPSNYEFVLTATAYEADALLTFQLDEDAQPVWLDAIRLQEAVIEPVNPDELIQLRYNPTTKDSLINLTDAYRDVKNHYYTRNTSVLLKPFSSLVLLRDTLPPVDIRLSLATKTSLRVGEVISVSLTLHNALASKGTLPSQVQWSCRLPASLTVVNESGLAIQDSLLRGTVQQVLTDTTLVFQVKALAPGAYVLAAQVTAATYADPTSTPDSGTDDGEDDQASVRLQVRELLPGETIDTEIVTATDPVEPQIEKNKVYPNPTADEFMFVAEDDILGLQLVDLLGRERQSLGAVRRGQLVRFGLLLPNAYYLLRIHYKTGEQRLVKLIKTGR